MAFTGIKIPILIQIDTTQAASDVSAFLSNLEAQVGKSTGTGPASKGPGTASSSTQANTISDRLADAMLSLKSEIASMGKNTRKNNNNNNNNQPPGGGSGNQPPASSPPGGGKSGPPAGTFGSNARGDRQDFAGRLASVAEYRIAATAVNTLFSGFSKGVNTVTEVQNEMQQMNKVLNTSQKNLNNLKSAAVSTAQEFGKSTTGVLKGFKVFAQQGLPTNEVIKYGKAVALASNVSSFGTEGLSELITAGIKTFGKAEVGADGLKLVDKFLAVEGARAVSEGDLADVFKRVGPQAQSAGIGVDELNALTTIIKERTRSESGEIGTALRFVIKNLQSSTTQKSLKEILPDLKFTDETGDLRDPYSVLRDISKSFPSLSRRKQAKISGEIGDTRFSSRTTALLTGLSQGEGEQIINIGKGAGGESFKRNQIVMQSLQKQFEKTGAAFEGFALSSGGNLVQPAMTLLKILEKSLHVLESMSKISILGGGQSGSLGSIVSAGAAIGTAGFVGKKLLGSGVATAAGVATGATAVGAGLGAVRGATGMATASSALGPLATLITKFSKPAGILAAVVASTAGGVVGGTLGGGNLVSTLGGAAIGAALSKGILSSIVSNGLGKTAVGLLTGASVTTAVKSLGGALSGFIPKVATAAPTAAGVMGSQALKSGAIGMVGAGIRGLGMGLGALATPIGFVISTAIAAALEQAIRRQFESSKDRLDRTGVTDQNSNAKETLESVSKLEAIQENIKNNRGFANQARSVGPLSSQLTAVSEGSLEVTAPEAEKRILELQKSQRSLLISNEKEVKKVGGIITRDNKILFADDTGTLADTQDSESASKNLNKAMKKQETREKVATDLAAGLDSLPERLAQETNTPQSDLAMLLTGRSGNEKLGEAQSRELQNNQSKIINDFLSGDSNKALEVLNQPGGEALLTDVVKKLPSASSDALKSLLVKSKGANAVEIPTTGSLFGELGGGGLGVYREMQKAKEGPNDVVRLIKENLFKSLSDQTDNPDLAKTSLNRGTSTSSDYANALTKAESINLIRTLAKPGDVVNFTDDQGKQGVGKVFEESGKKFVKSLTQGSEIRNSGTTTVTESATQSLSTLLRTATNFNLFKPPTSKQSLIDFDPRLTSAGFGAGKTLSSDFQSFSSGPNNLQDFSDLTAGTFSGFDQSGQGTFNTNLQDIFSRLQITQNDINAGTKTDEQGLKTTSTVGQINEAKLQIESGAVLGKAVESLGRVFKSFDASVEKLSNFKIEQKNAKEFSPVQTGRLAKEFGAAIPQFSLPAQRDELSSLDLSKLALPNTSKGLQESQFRLSSLGEQANQVDTQQEKLLGFLNSSRTEALAPINAEEFSKILSSTTGANPDDLKTTLGSLIQLDPEGTSQNRDQVVGNLTAVVQQAFNSLRERLTSSASPLKSFNKGAETDLVTANTLMQLRTAAEGAARSLTLIEKFKGFDNLNRALGQGPLGVVGPGGGPELFTQSQGAGGSGRKTAINFSNKNQFEIERDIINRRSRGDKITDSNGQSSNLFTPLTRDEATDARIQVDRKEKDARKAQELGRQRQVLQERQQVATQFIGSIDEVLANKELTPKAKSGLKGIQDQLIGLSKEPEKAFTNPRGGVNLQPFDILKNLGNRINSLLPQDVQSNIFKNSTEDQKKQLLQSGAISPEAAKATDAQQSVVQAVGQSNTYLAQIAANTGGKTAGVSDLSKVTPLLSQAGTTPPIDALKAQTVDARNQGQSATEAVRGLLSPSPGRGTRSILPLSGVSGSPIITDLSSAESLSKSSATQEQTLRIEKAKRESRTTQPTLPTQPESIISANGKLYNSDTRKEIITPNIDNSITSLGNGRTRNDLTGVISNDNLAGSITSMGNGIIRDDFTNTYSASAADEKRARTGIDKEFYKDKMFSQALPTSQESSVFKNPETTITKNPDTSLFSRVMKGDTLISKEGVSTGNSTNTKQDIKESVSSAKESVAPIKVDTSFLADFATGAAIVGSSISSALSEGVAGLSSAFSTLVSAMSSQSKSVGGDTVDQQTLMTMLTSRVSELEAANDKKLEDIQSSLDQGLLDVQAKYEELKSSIESGNQNDAQSKLDIISADLNNLSAKVNQAHELATSADSRSTQSQTRIPSIESTMNEVKAIANSAYGLATQAWGNQR